MKEKRNNEIQSNAKQKGGYAFLEFFTRMDRREVSVNNAYRVLSLISSSGVDFVEVDAFVVVVYSESLHEDWVLGIFSFA